MHFCFFSFCSGTCFSSSCTNRAPSWCFSRFSSLHYLFCLYFLGLGSCSSTQARRQPLPPKVGYLHDVFESFVSWWCPVIVFGLEWRAFFSHLSARCAWPGWATLSNSAVFVQQVEKQTHEIDLQTAYLRWFCPVPMLNYLSNRT